MNNQHVDYLFRARRKCGTVRRFAARYLFNLFAVEVNDILSHKPNFTGSAHGGQDAKYSYH
jgi:hypothetical protein